MLNRNRTARQSNNRNVKVSQEYINDLTVKDFLGELKPDEIPIAKKLGVYGWDLVMKNRSKEHK